MNSFLYRIAEVYYRHHPNDISRYSFVFPNRRAGLFFQQYLGQIAGKPIFSPEILTINDCFSMASDWQTADRLSMLFRLYRIFIQQSGSEESFDSFAFWGEMLLSDFEDVDKYRIDAQQLFSNVTELKEIDRMFNIFSEKQIEAIKQFWKNFIPVTEGKTQEDFIATWKILLPVYEQFRTELLKDGIATEGMISRDVADRLKNKVHIPEFDGKQFVFVGFNALNPCERALMAELQKLKQADFYWDYDALELRDADNPASRFFAHNLHAYPSRYTVEPMAEVLAEKDIELIAVPSAVGQAKQIYHILNDLYPSDLPYQSWIRTAVVLPDESLLVPLLHSLPQQVEKINITMGFPLKATPVSGLIEHIFELQRRLRASGGTTSFYHQTVSNILNHQYVSLLCHDQAKKITEQMTRNNSIYIEKAELQIHPLLKSIFEPQSDTKEFIPYLLDILLQLQQGWQNATNDNSNYQLECDFLYQYYITLNRMNDILKERPQEVDMNLDTLMRLTRQLTAGITIPFIGEPLDGLQVMGVLETRGLDFENLIITSFNEGIFPAKSSSNSFIPYNLRRGFELPTTEYQDAITAYNFYRLIHRAKRIFFIYDSRTEGMQTGEVSRFMHQLYYHYGVKAKEKAISFDIGFENPGFIEIKKSQAVMEKLEQFCSTDEHVKAFSASSLNSYIDCPLQFYLTRVETVEEADEVMETVEASMFGSLFHKVMENLYAPYKGKILKPETLDQILSRTLLIDDEILRAFNTEFFKRKPDQNLLALEGNNLLIASVLRKYIIQVLKTDKKYTPFKYVAAEERCSMQFPIQGGSRQINIKGFVDRIDEKEGRLRILDYKTGSGKLDFKNLEEVFEHNKDQRPKFVLQTFLYCLLYEQLTGSKNTTPGIFYIRDVFKEEFDTHLNNKELKEKVTAFDDYRDSFIENLSKCLEEIFNPDIPFTQTTNTKVCQYCSYVGVCNR